MTADRNATKSGSHGPRPCDPSAVATRASEQLASAISDILEPGLYLVATPIGNLSDITLRALSVLASADILYCEDTRHSARLLRHFAIEAQLRSYHEHNADVERPRILKALQDGKSVALFSDAGMPLISDPGYKLVKEAASAGHRVFSIPGASAPLTALVASGLPTDCFTFAGFLPPKKGARRSRIRSLSSVPGTLILFEAPSRLRETLFDLGDLLGDRQAAVARELSKLHEEYHRGSLSQLAQEFSGDKVKGEIVIVIAPGTAAEITDAEIASRLKDELKETSLRDASKQISDELNVPKARVYGIGLALKDKDGV
jgi:16S rRNA (cytidine1402-2'-O)-methyltransferase